MLPHSRIYASIVPARLECPACRRLIVFGYNQRDVKAFHIPTHRITCPSCRSVFTLGMLVWSSPAGFHHGEGPPDVTPSQRQIAELRQYTGGFWLSERYRYGEPAHRIIEAGCTCWPLPWRVGCPVHGGQAMGINPEQV